MIATLVAEETARTGYSTTSKKRKTHVNARHILVDVDERVWKEVCEHFTVTGVHSQTARLNHECRLIVATCILSALRSRDLQFSLNQAVQDKMAMVGHRKRKALVSFFRQSHFFATTMNHSTGNHSIIRTLKGAAVRHLCADQHNLVRCCIVGDGWCHWIDDGSDEMGDDGRCLLRSMMCHWAYSGKTSPVEIPIDWFRRYGQSYRDACASLFPEQWQFVPCIKSSLERAVVGKPTFEDCLKLASLRTPKAVSIHGQTRNGRWRC